MIKYEALIYLQTHDEKLNKTFMVCRTRLAIMYFLGKHCLGHTSFVTLNKKFKELRCWQILFPNPTYSLNNRCSSWYNTWHCLKFNTVTKIKIQNISILNCFYNTFNFLIYLAQLLYSCKLFFETFQLLFGVIALNCLASMLTKAWHGCSHTIACWVMKYVTGCSRGLIHIMGN